MSDSDQGKRKLPEWFHEASEEYRRKFFAENPGLIYVSKDCNSWVVDGSFDEGMAFVLKRNDARIAQLEAENKVMWDTLNQLQQLDYLGDEPLEVEMSREALAKIEAMRGGGE
jgi:hypothetical protein